MSPPRFHRAITLLSLLAGAAGAQETRSLACRDAAGTPFDMVLFSPAEGGAPLHCVLHPALEDFSPCAPQGGWGLSEETGQLRAFSAEAPRNHEGYWFFARVGPSEFVASASFGSRPPLALEVAGETFWRMRLALSTGEGVVETAEGETAVRCLAR